MSGEATHVYTKTGDDGTTGRLLGGRVAKDDPLIEACGDLDEAVAALGMARARLAHSEDPHGFAELVLWVQRSLFVVAADLMANPRARDRLDPGISLVQDTAVGQVEDAIDRVTESHPLAPVFVVPGADDASASLDLARAVVRRAERHTVAAARAGHTVTDPVLLTLNRTSDLLYVLARAVAGGDEIPSHD